MFAVHIFSADRKWNYGGVHRRNMWNIAKSFNGLDSMRMEAAFDAYLIASGASGSAQSWSRFFVADGVMQFVEVKSHAAA